MHYGFRIVEDMIDGLSNYLDEKGMKSVHELVGKSVPRVSRWENLDLNYKIIADINQQKCIGCGVCYVACTDGAHQSIRARAEDGRTHVEIIDDTCVGCNLCSLVCPVEGCITMKKIDTGREHLTWKEYQQNPSAHKHLGPHNAH
jgi:dihydropyrimidine dehydrogenase (NAD+) subunit PreA